MRLQKRDYVMLVKLAAHLVMLREDIQKIAYPDDKTGRTTRRRLSLASKAGFIKRRIMRDTIGLNGPRYVYQLAPKGCQVLADKLRDERYLAKPTKLTQPQHLAHYLSVSKWSRLLENAAKAQSTVKILKWYNEEHVLNWKEAEAGKQIKLYSTVQDKPRVICNPDGAFLTEFQNHRAVFYLEIERDTSGPRQVAKKKHQGYHLLQAKGLHKRHFPKTTLNTFGVLCVAMNRFHRDRLVAAFKDVKGRDLWRFAIEKDIEPETIFSAPIWCDITSKNPRPLIKFNEPKDSPDTCQESKKLEPSK